MPLMHPRRVTLAFVGVSFLIAGSEARAQFPIGTGPSVVVTSPSVVTTTTAAPVVAVPATRIYETRAMARRSLRQANRYTVSRPVYGDRVAAGFAPFSDYYFPTTAPLRARETVYASPVVSSPIVSSPVTVVRPTTVVTTPTVISPQPIYSVVRPR